MPSKAATWQDRAIALSLQDMKRKHEVIDLASDSEDEARFNAEIKRALEASEAEVLPASNPKQPKKPASKTAVVEASSSKEPSSKSPAPVSAFLAERAQLEKERRERQKRLRPETQVTSRDDEEKDKEDDSELEEPPAKRQRFSPLPNVRFNDSLNLPIPSSSSSAKGNASSQDIPTIEQLFWEGEMRQTANYHAEPRKDGQPTFRLTEILGKVSPLHR